MQTIYTHASQIFTVFFLRPRFWEGGCEAWCVKGPNGAIPDADLTHQVSQPLSLSKSRTEEELPVKELFCTIL